MNSFIQKYGGFLFVFIGVVGVIFLQIQNHDDTNVSYVTTQAIALETIEEITTTNDIFVDIKGAVQYPDVYMVGSKMRISDIVMMAGGLLENADVKNINLSKTVYDEMVIYIPFLSEETEVSTVIQEDVYFIDIKGEVKFPGVYEVSADSRVSDVIDIAGGLLDTADISGINRSMKIFDELVIYIPKIPDETVKVKVTITGEVKYPGYYYMQEGETVFDLIQIAGGLTTNADTKAINLEIILTNGLIVSIPSNSINSEQETAVSSLVNINTATLDQLMTLNGIGIILGQRIIDYRAEYGFFTCIEDIMNVSGIKESIYGQIQDAITV